MPPKACPDRAKLKAKFQELDKNGDGHLDFAELKGLLKKGDPNMSVPDIRTLFNAVDKDGNGTVDFDEFVDYIYSVAPAPEAGAKEGRSTEGRHARLEAGAAAAVGDDEGDWDKVKVVFDAYTVHEKGAMTGKTWAKLVTDLCLKDRKFANADVDILFAKACEKGARKLDFSHFQTLVRLVAQKKAISVGALQGTVAESTGPVIKGTAGACRFHDDKSTYTGAHTSVHGGGGEEHAGGRHDRLHAAEAAAADGPEADWGDVERVFNLFAGAGHDLEGNKWMKVCTDCHLICKKYTRADVDTTFAKVCPKGQRKIHIAEFKDALRLVATKKGVGVAEIQGKVGSSEGPVIKGTEGACRFHDDKSTFTGAHASVHGGGDAEREGGRHERLHAAEEAAAAEAGANEADWGPSEDIYDAYIGEKHGMDGRTFAKMLTDCNMYCKKFVKTETDIVFARVCPKGQRELSKDHFKEALRVIASKKGQPVSEVQKIIGSSSGPVIHATKADAVRFHDDKSSYTGAHATGGKHDE